MKKVICVAPGHCRIFVFLSVAHLKCLSKDYWPIKEIHESPSLFLKIYIYIYLNLSFPFVPAQLRI